MTTQQISFRLRPGSTATLSLPERLTRDAFARLEAAIGDALREPCRDDNTGAADDPGAIEFASWLIHLH